jgi:pimeloyl-ACP methyl ester carboxylesterase
MRAPATADWSFFYHYPLLLPAIGPRVIASPGGGYHRWLARWSGGGYMWSERDAEIYLSPLRHPARAYAGSQWYRTFQTREFLPWIRGEYADARVDVPRRWVTGLKDRVITPTMHRGYEDHPSDITFEHIPDARHWIVEQAHDLVLDRLRTYLRG